MLKLFSIKFCLFPKDRDKKYLSKTARSVSGRTRSDSVLKNGSKTVVQSLLVIVILNFG